MPRHIIIKLLRTKDKKKMWKVKRGQMGWGAEQQRDESFYGEGTVLDLDFDYETLMHLLKCSLVY
jgi:hypothetical protein